MRRTRWLVALLAPALLLAGACEARQAQVQPPPAPTATARATAAQPSATPVAAPVTPAAMSEAALMAHVRFLASPEMKGRDAATPEEQAAGRYIAERLADYGLVPLDGRRQQVFPVEEAHSANIWGLVRGADPAPDKPYVVVGAHYDHIGVRGGRIHPGAEDNASGVALVLELARALAATPGALGRSLIVVFFGAEEAGMIGSRAFVAQPPVPLASIHSMVNVDMIGRPLADQTALALVKVIMGIDGTRTVGVLGTDQRPVFRAIVEQSCADAGIRALAPEDLGGRLQRVVERMSRGRGDSYRFEAVGIPALFFSSGESDDYHQPGDTIDRINPRVMALRARAIKDVVVALSRAPADVTTAPAPPAAKAPSAPAGPTPSPQAPAPSPQAPSPHAPGPSPQP